MAETGAAAASAPAADAPPPVPAGPDADAILDQVLTEFGGGDADDAGTPPATDAPAADSPAGDAPPPAAPAKVEPVPNDVEAARLRKGFSKLAEAQQKLVDRENAARAAVQTAEAFRDKASAYDQAVAALHDPNGNPHAWLHSIGGDALIDRVLSSTVAAEKSPAERQVEEMRRELQTEKARQQQTAQQQQVEAWRGGIVKAVADAGEKYDLVNTLGLHGQVIDVITGYYEKHSVRDARGNVTEPAILPWETAAEAVETSRAEALEKGSKRWGKRAAAPAPAATPAKAAPPSNGTPPKRSGSPTLSSVPVAEGPARADDLPLDDLDERFNRVMAELNV